MDARSLNDYYSAVNISATSFFGNVVSLRRWGSDLAWGSLGKPVDRDDWYVILIRIRL